MANINLNQTPQEAATIFMNHIKAGDYTAATAMLSPEMQQALQALPLQLQMEGRHGDLLSFEVLSSTQAEGFDFVAVSADHNKGAAVHNIILDSSGAVAGIQPVSFAFQPKMPPEGASYTAQPIIIGEGGSWPLDGLLTMPQGASHASPVPAIILIPGSGANNMDSSLFQNRPFFDIADYLSSNGIAVLRFNERAFSHGMQVAQIFGATNFTMQEEYVEDALLAVELLRKDDRIGQVFLLGHSMGGIIAPRIAEEAGLDGVVIMASSPRPLHQIWYDQNINLIRDAVNSGQKTPAEANEALALLATQMEHAINAVTLPAGELENVFLFDMFPALYEQSLVQSLPLPFIAANTARPVLILQAGRDFHTTVKDDFQIFLDATAGMTHVTTRLYETLNHLMMTAIRQEGDLVVDVMEYVIPGRVDTQVLRDITDWILENK
ncbi:MAG: alpha/beta fold hydrolase [Defluviitaleaceae bacterium]|nr:alpha/beta fold hydrolase [Defluviitaleaceae bacterium]